MDLVCDFFRILRIKRSLFETRCIMGTPFGCPSRCFCILAASCELRHAAKEDLKVRSIRISGGKRGQADEGRISLVHSRCNVIS